MLILSDLLISRQQETPAHISPLGSFESYRRLPVPFSLVTKPRYHERLAILQSWDRAGRDQAAAAQGTAHSTRAFAISTMLRPSVGLGEGSSMRSLRVETLFPGLP
jgi:hypothetical protein